MITIHNSKAAICQPQVEKYVWTGDVGPSLYSEVPYLEGGLYGEFQCIMGNANIGTLCEDTGTPNWKHYLPTTSLAGGDECGVNKANSRGEFFCGNNRNHNTGADVNKWINKFCSQVVFQHTSTQVDIFLKFTITDSPNQDQELDVQDPDVTPTTTTFSGDSQPPRAGNGNIYFP